MSELSRDEAVSVVAAAVVAVRAYAGETTVYDEAARVARDACEHTFVGGTALAGGGGKIGRGDDGTTCRTGTGGGDVLDLPPFNTITHNGRSLDLGGWFNECVKAENRCTSLESRLAEAENEKRRIHGLWESANSVYELQKAKLAAAEKRAEEAEREQDRRMHAAVTQCSIEERERVSRLVGECDALKAELAEAKKRLDDAGMANARADAHAEDIAWYLARFNDLRRALELPPGVGLTRQDMYTDLFNGIRQEMRIRREFMTERDAAINDATEARSAFSKMLEQRDAALARVKELEASGEERFRTQVEFWKMTVDAAVSERDQAKRFAQAALDWAMSSEPARGSPPTLNASDAAGAQP